MRFGKKKTLIEVDYHEVDELIKSHYGHDFQCVADMEWSNDTSHSVEFSEHPLDSYAAKKVEQFKATGKGSYLTWDLLQDLVNRKVIEPGDYLVSISW